MPNYPLKCPKCNHTWVEFLWISERDNAKCPKCGTKAEYDYGAKGGSVMIQGKGFYQENTLR